MRLVERALVYSALAIIILASGYAVAHSATEDATVGFGEGSNAGNVTLTLNGISEAHVLGLVLDQATGHWMGVGKVDYTGQGITIQDDDATFAVDFEPSPSPLSSCTDRVSRLPSWILIVGSKASYTIETSNREVIMTSTTCPRVNFTATIDDHPKGRGKLKQPAARNRTVSGRVLRP